MQLFEPSAGRSPAAAASRCGHRRAQLECVILHVADDAAHDMAELLSTPLDQTVVFPELRPGDLVDGSDLGTRAWSCIGLGVYEITPLLVRRGKPVLHYVQLFDGNILGVHAAGQV